MWDYLGMTRKVVKYLSIFWRDVGLSRHSKKNCKLCVKISEMDLFTSTVTIKTYKVNHKLDCDDKCLIYQLTSNQRRKQYV